MIFESTYFLLKINVIFDVDVKDECVKNSCEKFDVAKFERFVFSLIENENDFDVMKREKDFHLRIYKKVML